MPDGQASDTEQERRRLLEEIVAEHEPEWLEHFKPGSFGCHELLDRTSLVADTLEGYVLSHPACLQNREWFELAWQAVSALRELYQRVGGEQLDGPDEAPDGSRRRGA